MDYKIDINHLFIFILTFGLFTSFNFITIGSFVLSLKKIIVFLSIIFMLFKVKNFSIDSTIIIYSIFFIIILNLKNLINFNFDISAIISIFPNIFFVTLLIKYLNENSLNNFFLKTWIFYGLVMSFLAILQTLGLAPQVQDQVLGLYSENYYSVDKLNSSSLNRATGLFIDPNFFVVYLLIASVLNRYIIKNKYYELLIFLGILATFSRMGLIIYFFTYLFSNNMLQTIKYTFLLTISFILMIFILPESFTFFATDRFLEIFNLQSYLTYNLFDSIDTNSTIARFLTLIAAKDIFLQNIWFGIGIGNIRDIYEIYLGFSTVTHNTFIEFFIISGIFGLILNFYLIKYLLQAMLSDSIIKKQISVIFLISFSLLSTITNLMLFFPILFIKIVDEANISKNLNH
tara:strand:+ start:75 stop:1280 length:1206 start_codon:yes stop_codon:yes gene_type:complete